ncbi:hypothetical protein, partial [Streptomyces sp. NPDC003832]
AVMMNREGWRAYAVKTRLEYGQPSIRAIINNAKACESSSTLGRSTVSDTFTGKTWPTAQTAKWIGMGIGGKALGDDFASAWHAAEKNHKDETRAAALEYARRVQAAQQAAMSATHREEARKEGRRRAAARKSRRTYGSNGTDDGTPRWERRGWHGLACGPLLLLAVDLAAVIAVMVFMLIRYL